MDKKETGANNNDSNSKAKTLLEIPMFILAIISILCGGAAFYLIIKLLIDWFTPSDFPI